MPLEYRVLLGCVAIVGAGFCLRALQTGVVYGRNWTPYDRDKDLGQYVSHMLGGLIGITICAWMAAGYTLADFLAPFGLSAFVR